MKAFISKLPRHVILQILLLLIFPLNLVLVILADLFPDFVEAFYSNGFFPAVMQAVSRVTGVLPFSLGEVLVITAAVSAVIFTVAAVVRMVKTAKAKGKTGLLVLDYVTRVIAIALCGVLIFNIMYGFSYYRKNTSAYVYDRYVAYTVEDIAWVASYLADDVNEARTALDIPDGQPFSLDMSYAHLSEATMQAYDNLGKDYPVYSGNYGRPKPVSLSKPWTYTFVMGMYFPFTGEANYNTNIPDVELPHTVLHEMAHQRGIAAEDEANFAAFLASVYSDDPYVKYSGLFESFVFVLNAVRYSNEELYSQLLVFVDEGVKTDMAYVNSFWDGYNTPLAEISNDINNAYLESNGQEMGAASYSLSVQYILDYYVNTHLSDFISK